MADWKNRIIGTDVKPASWFLASEKNWRIHPVHQQSALIGSLSEVGWVQDVIVNLRSDPSWGADRGVETLVDGHLRVSLALREGDDTPIPVKYIDLLPGEENIILSTFDPIAALAVADKQKLDALIRDTTPANAALQQMLSVLAAREGLYTGNGSPVDDPLAEWQGMPEFVHEDKTAFQTIALHFKDQQAIDEFAELVGQKITPKTRFLWYPQIEIETYADKRYAPES